MHLPLHYQKLCSQISMFVCMCLLAVVDDAAADVRLLFLCVVCCFSLFYFQIASMFALGRKHDNTTWTEEIQDCPAEVCDDFIPCKTSPPQPVLSPSP